jgi:hypothetical protein
VRFLSISGINRHNCTAFACLYFLACKGVLIWVRIQRAARAAMHATNLATVASEPPFSQPFLLLCSDHFHNSLVCSNPLHIISNQQCFESLTFLYGYADPYYRITDPDPDPDPVLFFGGLQDRIKKSFFPLFFCLLHIL